MIDPLPPEALLAHLSEERQATAEHLRALVRRVIPDATEAVRTGWRVISYAAPNGRRAAYFGFVMPEVEHVHLGFAWGVLMRDRHGILGGTELKRARFVTMRRPGEIADAILEELVRDAARLACLSSSERFASLLDPDRGLTP